MRNYKEFYYDVDDGLTLFARDYPGPENRSGCVLMMHGLTRNSRDFEVLAEKLSSTHRVLVAEQRGRGKSDWDSQPERYAISILFYRLPLLLLAALSLALLPSSRNKFWEIASIALTVSTMRLPALGMTLSFQHLIPAGPSLVYSMH